MPSSTPAKGPTAKLPATGLEPLHAPVATHTSASTVDHCSVENPLYGTDVSVAVKFSVGGGGLALF